MSEKKGYVSVSKGVHKKLTICKSLCNLQKLYTALKKHTNVNIGFSMFCASLVDIAAGDVINIDSMQPHGS